MALVRQSFIKISQTWQHANSWNHANDDILEVYILKLGATN